MALDLIVTIPVAGAPQTVQVPALQELPPPLPLTPAATSTLSTESTTPVAKPEVASLSHSGPLFSRTAGRVMTLAGAALLGFGVAGVVYSLQVHGAVDRQQPGGPNAGAPTVTLSQYQQAAWIYPASLVSGALGLSASASGLYFWLRPTDSGGLMVGGQF